MNIISCGLIVRSPDGILLAHATYTPRWDIPKGRLEDNELPLKAAMRECFEETNLDLAEHEGIVIDLGQQPYIRGKDLHVFLLDLPTSFSLDECSCHTVIEQNGKIFPETDRWEWVKEGDVLNKVGKGLGNLLIGLNIVPNPGANWWNERTVKKPR